MFSFTLLTFLGACKMHSSSNWGDYFVYFYAVSCLKGYIWRSITNEKSESSIIGLHQSASLQGKKEHKPFQRTAAGGLKILFNWATGTFWINNILYIGVIQLIAFYSRSHHGSGSDGRGYERSRHDSGRDHGRRYGDHEDRHRGGDRHGSYHHRDDR